MRRPDSYELHLRARTLRARAMAAACRRLLRAAAGRLQGLAGRVADGLRLAA